MNRAEPPPASSDRRKDLYSSYRVEVGIAYLQWFGAAEADLYLQSHGITPTISLRVLTSDNFRKKPSKKVSRAEHSPVISEAVYARL